MVVITFEKNQVLMAVSESFIFLTSMSTVFVGLKIRFRTKCVSRQMQQTPLSWIALKIASFSIGIRFDDAITVASLYLSLK